jgi:polyisoprenoid-binding protein YceI
VATTSWNIDTAHTGINFSVRHMAVSRIRGRFERYRGSPQARREGCHTIQHRGLPSTPPASTPACPIATCTCDRADFFDADKFPELRFRAKRIHTIDDHRYNVIGDLTIRDVTREVALGVEYGGRATDPWGYERIGFIVKTTVERRDFGLEWNQPLEAGGVLFGNRVDIDIELEAVRLAERNVA